MSADAERTLPPTQRRLAKARSQGNSARSPVAAAAFTLAACAAMACVVRPAGEWWLAAAREAAVFAAGAPRASTADLSSAAVSLLRAAEPWWVVACAWLFAMCGTVCAAAVCGGISPAWSALRLDANRLSWAAGAKKLAALDGAGAAIALSGAASVAIAGAAAVHAWAGIAAQAAEFNAVMAALGAALSDLWRRAAPLAIVVGAADIVLQRVRHARNLRMSPREAKEERTDNEGRPETKARRRNAGAKRARGFRISAIRDATAVVTNPTHIAVALRYDPPQIDVPVVVARGADIMAALVRGAAENYGVPIVDAPELARMLYAQSESDGPIPEEAYAAVAAVFAWILRTRGTLSGGRSRAGDDTESEAS